MNGATVGPRAGPVLVTGCSSGIGHCVSRGLRDAGYRVIASARRPEDVDRLQSLGLEAVRLDVADPASIREAVEQVLERTDGALYALFNNAGYGQPGAVEDLSRDALREQFETNLFGAHELTCRVLPTMLAARQGRIIQNSSVLGFVSLMYRGAYNASKHALEGLSDTLRMELRGSGVHVSLVEPGPIESRFRQNAHAAYRRYVKPTSSRHAGTYRMMEQRLEAEGPVAPFTLPAEAVLVKVRHALESAKPKARYYVTFPTYLFAALKRMAPSPLLESILRRVS